MSVKNKTNKNYKRSQKGRSMVEMLGVLAIIGVLSVGGLYGYGVAMKKHKANELLHRASMLASTVSAQIMTGKNPTTLDSFANSDLGTFTLETYTDGDNTFKLKISNIDDNVCEQMKSSMGGMVRDIVCDENAKTALMTFNKDLSTTDLPKTESVIDKNITNPEDCQKAGKTWCVEASSGSGQCSNSTDCCRGVSAPTCKDCTVVEGGYTFTNVLPSAECDSDGDGINDGQCIPDESTMIYTCQQVSCQETESCCMLNNMDMLADVLNDPTTLEAMGVSLSTLAKQAHQAQCSSCDPSDGRTTPLADGTNCVYFSDTSSVEMMQQFMSAGQCQSGSCTTDRPCDLQHLENCCLPYTTDPFEFATEEMIQMLGWEKIADLLNHYQCGTCDTSSLQIQSKLDGTSCNYVFINGDNEPEGMPGSCQNGVCSQSQCDGFFGYLDRQCYPCDSDESPNMSSQSENLCTGKCPNRKAYYPRMTDLYPESVFDGLEDYLCVKTCPEGTFETTNKACIPCDYETAVDSTTEMCEGRCTNRELINGKCVLKQV